MRAATSSSHGVREAPGRAVHVEWCRRPLLMWRATSSLHDLAPRVEDPRDLRDVDRRVDDVPRHVDPRAHAQVVHGEEADREEVERAHVQHVILAAPRATEIARAMNGRERRTTTAAKERRVRVVGSRAHTRESSTHHGPSGHLHPLQHEKRAARVRGQRVAFLVEPARHARRRRRRRGRGRELARLLDARGQLQPSELQRRPQRGGERRRSRRRRRERPVAEPRGRGRACRRVAERSNHAWIEQSRCAEHCFGEARPRPMAGFDRRGETRDKQHVPL